MEFNCSLDGQQASTCFIRGCHYTNYHSLYTCRLSLHKLLTDVHVQVVTTQHIAPCTCVGCHYTTYRSTYMCRLSLHNIPLHVHMWLSPHKLQLYVNIQVVTTQSTTICTRVGCHHTNYYHYIYTCRLSLHNLPLYVNMQTVTTQSITPFTRVGKFNSMLTFLTVTQDEESDQLDAPVV